MKDLSVLCGDALGLMTPLLLAAIGGLFTELAGMLNIALEGLITIGAFAAAAAVHAVSASPHFPAAGNGAAAVIALVAGSLAGGMVALGYGIGSQRLKANEFVAGLATNLLATGIVVALADRLLGNKGVVSLAIPGLARPLERTLGNMPFLGELLFRQDILTYASWFLVIVASFVITKSTFGLRLRASGSNPGALATLGRNPKRYRLVAVVLSGLACGLAGAALTVSLSAYVPDMSAGRGWIALVAIYLGGKKAGGVLAACFVFAFAESLSNYAQGVLRVPSDFILALPYAITLAALIGGAAWKRLRGGQIR